MRLLTAQNFSDIRLIKENYKNLKNKLGRIPALKDFDHYGEMDVLRIFDNNSLGSYYKFLAIRISINTLSGFLLRKRK